MEYSRIIAGLMRVRSLIGPASKRLGDVYRCKLEVDELVADVSKSAHFFWRYKYLTESNQHVIYQLSSEQPKSYEASLIEHCFALKKCSACTTARKI